MRYTVCPGDRLSEIDRSHGLAPEALPALNPDVRGGPDRVRAGAALTSPDDAAPPEGATGAAGVTVAAAVAATWVLGQLSSRYETGGRGPGVVSTGNGDAGGVSYGSYQMTSVPDGGTVARFVADPGFPFRARFAGLAPGSAAFTTAWRALAAERPDAFHAAQHDFIRRTHFDPMVAALKDAAGIDVSARSPALQDCCWSTAVQHGPRNAIARGVCEALRAAGAPRPEDGNAYDEALIRAIYAERGRRRHDGYLVHFSRNAPAVQAGVARRFERELRDALAMLRRYGGAG
jgi:type VI secretion system (T6SS) spike protein VgrG3